MRVWDFGVWDSGGWDFGRGADGLWRGGGVGLFLVLAWRGSDDVMMVEKSSCPGEGMLLVVMDSVERFWKLGRGDAFGLGFGFGI